MSLTLKETKNLVAYDAESEDFIYYSSESTGDSLYTDGNFELVPNLSEGFEFVYITGISGSGKSTVARDYALNYRRLFPKNDIYLITQSDETNVKEDKRIFDDFSTKQYLKHKRIYLDDSFIEKDIDVAKNYHDCLIIFDDFLYVNNKNILLKVINMIQQILSLGRKINVYCVITSHLIYERNNQRLYTSIQNEIHKLVWFRDNKTNKKQLKYCLSEYWGLSNKLISRLLNFDKNSRWVCLNRSPLYVVAEHLVEVPPEI